MLDHRDVRLYFRNKDILFEAENERAVSKLVSGVAGKLSSPAASASRVVFSERITEYPLIFQFEYEITRKSRLYGQLLS
jgi:hypothetical protein